MEIHENIAHVRQRLADAARAHGRAPDSIILLAATKQRLPAELEQAIAGGLLRFGESYVQEARDKIKALPGRGIEWHFIGPLQSNKTRGVAINFDWVQSLGRLDIARRLSEQRLDEHPPLSVCLQVNISGEHSKSGVTPEGLTGLAEQVHALPRLRLRGLMAIPQASEQPDRQRAQFARLRELYERLVDQGYPLDTLSMGMTNDLEAAIAEGSTLVRVGTGLFGPRA